MVIMKNSDVQQLYNDILFCLEGIVTNPNLNEAKIREIGIDLAFQVIFSSSGTSYEAVGMIEKVKDVYKKHNDEMLERLKRERLKEERLEEVAEKELT